jgi:hypothetical protein
MHIEPRSPERLAGLLLAKPQQRRIIACQKIFDRITASFRASHSALVTLVSVDLIRHIAP